MASLDSNWTAAPVKSRYDGGGLQYSDQYIDNTPRPRGMNNLLQNRQEYRQLKTEADDEIMKLKQEKMMENRKRQEARKWDIEEQDRYYPWDRLNQGHGAPKGDSDYRRRKFMETDTSPAAANVQDMDPPKPPKGHDLFVNTLGGPGGTVVRQDGQPSLQAMPDPRMTDAARPGQHQDLVTKEREIEEQKHRIADLKRQLEMLKSPKGTDQRDQRAGNRDKYDAVNSGYEPSFGSKGSTPARPTISSGDDRPQFEHNRSLNLEASRGGAGAPMRDDNGKSITRFPVTMGRDDFGAARIREQIPGKRYNIPDDPVYDPFGRPGGGAPMIDRQGKKNTHTFGNFEKKADETEIAKHARAKEVMLHQLRTGMEEQQRNKELDTMFQKAPPGELAELMRSKEVGRPKVDPITGVLTNQPLRISDVSKVKMNYQPKDMQETRNYNVFLKEQMEENERSKCLDKLRNKQESNKHFEEFDQRWGTWGGGAPKDRMMRKKVNLDNALFHYDQESFDELPSQSTRRKQRDTGYIGVQPKILNPSYQKTYIEQDTSDVTPRYVRNTVQSTSKNLYDYPAVDRTTRKMHQAAHAPYATGSAHAF